MKTEKDIKKTRVIFRKWGNGEIIALFPDEKWGGEMITSYEHFGQHGEANYSWVMSITSPATPEEFAMLKDELENLMGYNLKIRI